MRLVTSIVLFFVSMTLHAKSTMPREVDSLLNCIKRSKSDTVKVNLYNEICNYYYRSGDYELEKKYAEYALDLSLKINWSKGIIDGYRNLGGAYEDFMEWDKAIENYRKSLHYSQKTGNIKGQSAAYHSLGSVWYYKAEYLKALEYYQKSLELKRKIKDRFGMAVTYNNMGNVYHAIGNYPEALKRYYSALKIHEEADDQLGIADGCNNIGVIQKKLGNYDEALKNYKKALKLFEKNNDRTGVAGAFNNLGVIYKIKGQYALALKSYESALEINQEMNDERGMANSFNNIASVYYAQKEYQQSLEMNAKALTLRRRIGDRQGVTLALNNTGSLNMYLKNYVEARKNVNEAKALASELGLLASLRDSYKFLAELDSVEQKWKSHSDNYKRYIQCRDSIYNEENSKKAIQTQMQFEFNQLMTADSIKVAEERKIVEVRLAAERKQRQYLWLGLCLVVLFAIFIFNRFRVTQKQKKLIELKESETQRQKKLIEEKQKEILDSIHYSKRIQNALMPSEKLINKTINSLNKETR